MTENEIGDKYKALHDNLSKSYYSGQSDLTKEAFDAQHGQVWVDMEAELIAEGYRKPPEPVRDLEKEIDELKAKVEAMRIK